MSWEISAEYYRIINREVRRRLGGVHSARTLMWSVDFGEIERLQHRGEPRAVGDLVHVETFFARNLGGLIHIRTRVPGRLGKATSRTPSMYVDEKSDEAVVLAKRLNKGR
jgi:aspartate racemase